MPDFKGFLSFGIIFLSIKLKLNLYVMENIFNKIGYTLSRKSNSTNDSVLDVLCIKNPDGSIRWVWNANNKKPLFLKFYNVGNKRAKLFAFMIKMVFALRLQKLIFSRTRYFYNKETITLFDCNDAWALFTGTVGPNNKAILYTNNSFFKIATTNNAQELIKKENRILNNNAFSNFRVPKSKQISDDIIQLSDVTEKGIRTGKIGSGHLKALDEMNFPNDQIVKINSWKLFNDLRKDFSTIKDERIPKNLMRKINILIDGLDPEEVVGVSLSHGDFTSWNMYESDGKISLYDWELATYDRPKGFDYFHYLIQQGVMVDRKCWKDIYEDIKDQCSGDFCNTAFGYDLEIVNRYLKFYLLINCMNYLKVYASQPNWHIQINWLFEVWNEAMNMFLTESKSSRQLMIMDLFDHIQNENYAAVKFLNGYPENLSINSDIDLIVENDLNDKLINFFEKHSLVTKMVSKPKSFMNTIQLILNEGSFLSIDLIWQPKRRNVVFMEVKKVLKNAYLNNFGVRTTSVSDTMQYISGFYSLNNAAIPEKFKVYEEAAVDMNKKNDSIVNEYFQNYVKDKKALMRKLRKIKENRGLNAVKNMVLYFYDTLTSFRRRGFVVTFSGVDGAGKSTVIENVAQLIEKQLRLPVVILRHRPSVLPIISVIFKGREEAKRIVESSLPRTGNNTSFLSSLLRFSYYYTDYFIGQFLVYIKYTLRGYVVIYDRYYFDFIGDAKRSNVVLPKGLSFFGYRFLLKPKFNFFLFADTQTILERKKELDESAIKELTNNYGSLFGKLGKQSKSEIYEVIENNDLNITLNHVLLTIKSH